ncbi:MAG: efflux RND transporter periplasmic adaptor subunit [Bacillota bacterium]|nr:efflux RND transporter periplasmic adaptor subunit [Bacillota bacterium]
MWRRVIGWVLVAVILVGGGTYAYKKLLPKPEESAGPVYATAKVKRGDLRVAVEAVGQLQPIYRGELVAPVDGTLVSIEVQRGQQVEAGQLVATLRNDQVGYELQNLMFEVEQLRLELASVLGVPPEQVTRVDPNRGVGVYAPISGRVTELTLKNGDKVAAGDLVARIVDDATVVSVAEVNPGDVKRIAVGQKAQLWFEEFATPVEGVVTVVDDTPVPKDNYLVCRVTIEAKNEGLLKPGMKYRLSILSPQGTVEVGEPQTIDRYKAEDVVRSSAAGTVTRVHVKNMQRVQKGDLIVSMGGESTRRFIEQKQLEIRQKELQIAQKEEIRNKLEIRAPTAGRVAWIWGNPGMKVQAGQGIGTVFDNSKMNLHVMIDELDVVHVKEGQEATITVEAMPGKSWTAKVLQVDMMGQTEGGFAQYGCMMEVSGTEELKPGMTANVSIFVGEKKDVLLIPIEAVFEEDGEAKVEILTDQGPQTVPVKIGLCNDRWAEVVAGLEEGQLVITGSSLERLGPEKPPEQKEGLVLPGTGKTPGGKTPETKPAPGGGK